jgi:hypothetical protein
MKEVERLAKMSHEERAKATAKVSLPEEVFSKRNTNFLFKTVEKQERREQAVL